MNAQQAFEKRMAKRAGRSRKFAMTVVPDGLLKEANRMMKHLSQTGNLFKHKPKDPMAAYTCEKFNDTMKDKSIRVSLSGHF